MSPSLWIKNYQKNYDKKQVLIDDLVTDSKVILLIGENGCGKTTVLKSLSLLLCFEGEASVGTSWMYMSDAFKPPAHFTVNQYLNHVCALSNTANYEQMRSLITYFDMEKHKHIPIKNLSKGMHQKVNIIQTLCESKDVYLMDEPLDGLDAKNREKFIEYLKKSTGIFVCATHNPSHYERLSPEKIYL